MKRKNSIQPFVYVGFDQVVILDRTVTHHMNYFIIIMGLYSMKYTGYICMNVWRIKPRMIITSSFRCLISRFCMFNTVGVGTHEQMRAHCGDTSRHFKTTMAIVYAALYYIESVSEI